MKKLALAGLLLGSFMAVQVQAAAPNASILLKTNQQMVNISLGANPSTGYQWYVLNYDHDLLGLENYRYVANAKNGKVGVGGAAVFTFSVDPRFYDAPQRTLVTFVYERPTTPGVNVTTIQVSVSAKASSNDYSNWQKYPQLAGPAAEVQASEAEIKMEDQGTQFSAPPVLVQAPGSNANPTPMPAATPAKATTAAAPTVASPAAVTNNAASTSTSDVSVAAPSTNSNQDTGTVMPAGQPTPETDSQSQWLSLPANSAPATNNSNSKAAGNASAATTSTTTASPSSAN